MTKAVESGLPKRLIEEAATRRQAAVDKGEEVIVGVNKFRLEQEDNIDILEIDNTAVRNSQIARLNRIKETRNKPKVEAALSELEKVARTGEGNILAAAVEASRARATVGEISDAMRSAFGDHAAVPKVVSKVYGTAYENEPEYLTLVERLEEFSRHSGDNPRLMVAKLGQDGHDRGAKIIASAFGDIGFEVLAGPLFQTPDEAADMAIKAKVHVLGVSSLAAGHKTLLPQLVETLRRKYHRCMWRGRTAPRLSISFRPWRISSIRPRQQCT
jgi:methylmalonyl-CoA mutase